MTTMKPELNTIIAATCFITDDAARIRQTFLAALHWRGDELWCGPLFFGCVSKTYRSPWKMYTYTRHMAHLCGRKPTNDTARAALETAARDQINTWFKE